MEGINVEQRAVGVTQAGRLGPKLLDDGARRSPLPIPSMRTEVGYGAAIQKERGGFLPAFGYVGHPDGGQDLAGFPGEPGQNRAVGQGFDKGGGFVEDGLDLGPEGCLGVVEDGPEVAVWGEEAVHGVAFILIFSTHGFQDAKPSKVITESNMSIFPSCISWLKFSKTPFLIK